MHIDVEILVKTSYGLVVRYANKKWVIPKQVLAKDVFTKIPQSGLVKNLYVQDHFYNSRFQKKKKRKE